MHNATLKAALAGVVAAATGIALVGAVGQSPELKPGQAAPQFSATGSDGKPHSLASLTKGGPMVLYFIKDGCPVNHEAAPFVAKIANAFGPKANIVGVYNGDVAGAKRWSKSYKAPYVVLSDPQMKIIRSYGAPWSPYLVAVGQDGKVTKVFEGASVQELTKVNQICASGAGKAMASISFAGAPAGGG